jgi:hypothetical protein
VLVGNRAVGVGVGVRVGVVSGLWVLVTGGDEALTLRDSSVAVSVGTLPTTSS